MAFFGKPTRKLEVSPWIFDLVYRNDRGWDNLTEYIGRTSEHLGRVGPYNTPYTQGHSRELSEARRVLREASNLYGKGYVVKLITRR